MYKQMRTLALVSAIALSLITASGTAFADSVQDITNARQESRISTSYALSPYLRAHEINVVVDNGKANSGEEHALAIQIAENVRGVKDVNSGGLTHAN